MLVKVLFGFTSAINHFHLATTLTNMIIAEMPANKLPDKTTSSDDKVMPIRNTITPMMNMINNFL